jgi:hypothetical protein
MTSGVRSGYRRIKKRLGGRTGASLLKDLEEAKRRMQEQFGPNIVDRAEKWCVETLQKAKLPTEPFTVALDEMAQKAGYAQGSDVVFAAELFGDINQLRSAVVRNEQNLVLHYALYIGATIREWQDQHEWGANIDLGLRVREGGRKGAEFRFWNRHLPAEKLREMFAAERAKGAKKMEAYARVRRLTGAGERTIQRAVRGT